jgi:hypothetical protein
MEIEGTDQQNDRLHSKTFEWFDKLDQFLDEQDIVLDALKHGLTAGNINEDEYQEYAQEYIKHRFEKPM